MTSDGVMDVISLKTKSNIKKKIRYILFVKPIIKFFRGYVLDMGCGAGEHIENYNNQSLGIDAHENNIQHCQKKGLNVIKADVNSYKEPETFDTVLLSHIIEHLNVPYNAIENAYISTKIRGRIIIVVPTYKGFMTGFNDLVGHKQYITEQYLDHYLVDQLGCKKIYSRKFPFFEFISDEYQELRTVYIKCPNGENSN